MILLLILLVYYLGVGATLLLICKNASLETFLEEGGEKPLYKIACIMAVLIWPITLIIGLMTLISRKNEDNT